jgi:uncharacterized protein YjiS (DUF1127 family)
MSRAKRGRKYAPAHRAAIAAGWRRRRARLALERLTNPKE